uniref:transposase n=1 Tax=Halostagnicola kamekurae TaxID=619731 RepID=UPI001FE8DD2A
MYGPHVGKVEPEDTRKECASCGFEADRDANAAMNVLQHGILTTTFTGETLIVILLTAVVPSLPDSINWWLEWG